VEELDSLKPYGEGNPQALFATYGIRKKNMPKKTNYGYSVWLTDSSTTLEGIVYDKDILEILRFADKLDIVFSLGKNNYHNLPRLTIKDCRIS
jgi:hypothetical protein